MRIRCDHERTGNYVSAFDHDLVADARARRIEIHAVLFGEGFDGAVLLLVRFVLVLDVVIEGEHHLLRVFQPLRADALELAHDGRRVVVRHAAMRTDGEEISGAQRTIRPFGHVFLRDLLNDGLSHKQPLSISPNRIRDRCGRYYP